MKMKEWIKEHTSGIIIFLILLVGGYYMYLTHVSTIFHLDGTYYTGEDTMHVVLQFDDEGMTVYSMDFSGVATAMRTEYDVYYRTYVEDLLGIYWSDEGPESLLLRGSDMAGRIIAEPTGAFYFDAFADTEYLDLDDLEQIEKDQNTDYSIKSDFYLSNDKLCIFQLGDFTIDRVESLPEDVASMVEMVDLFYVK